MAIIKFLLAHRATQFSALIVATILLLISIGVRFDLNKSEWSGWAQAVGSFIAIMASGWIASYQTRSQFQAAVRLQRAVSSHEAHQMAKATEVIACRVVDIFSGMVSDFGKDRMIFSGIADGLIDFDRNLLVEMRADLDAIPLHELLSSRLVEQLILMRSSVRQVLEKTEAAFRNHRSMNAVDFDTFFQSLDDTKFKLRGCVHAIRHIKLLLWTEVNSLSAV